MPSSSSSSAARFEPRPLVCFDPADAIFFEIVDPRVVGISIWWRPTRDPKIWGIQIVKLFKLSNCQFDNLTRGGYFGNLTPGGVI